MIIALDFDKTYEAIPEIMDQIIEIFQNAGQEVILATYRHPVIDKHPLLDHLSDDLKIKCYFTDGKGKKKFLDELGIFVDIWIDDNPNSILKDSAWVADSPELYTWREEQKAKLEDSTLKVCA